ncbi:MAG TPA: glycoside hydrolase family 15 protein [Motilibacteraceae bacterium]|nr:glycoside hydrolase family 15 protein [Motilibacteraceae bacterium]
MALAAAPAPARSEGARLPLLVAGVAGTPGDVVPLAPRDTLGRYLPGSSILQQPSGRLVVGARPPAAGLVAAALRPAVAGTDPVTAARAVAAAAASRAWLTSGRVPGRTGLERAIAERALLDLRLLTAPDGAVVAADHGYWAYVWPRDAAFVAAAFAATGHRDEALSVLRWVAGVQDDDGTWQARYHPGDGSPVLDGRPPQLDAVGWVPWAAWFWVATAPDPTAAVRALDPLWSSVARAADAAAGSLGPDGLPRPTPDYWETAVDGPTVETVASLRAGLRAAADLAQRRGDVGAHERWQTAADRLDEAARRTFGETSWQRYPDGGGADAAVALLGPPFAPAEASVTAAVARASTVLAAPAGGLRPGEDWGSDRSVSWTPATGFVLLAAAAGGDRPTADGWLRWFEDHTTSLGALPEKVDARGRPASVAPLAWTDALVLLALVARDHGLPVPPR